MPNVTLVDSNQNLVGTLANPLQSSIVASGSAIVGFNGSIDANSSNQAALQVMNYSLVYNGANWDRQRGDTNLTVVGPGLTASYWNYAAAVSGIVNSVVAVTIKAAAGAGVRNYLKTLTIDHDLLGAATEIAIRDGAAGTVLWRGKLQTPATESRAPIQFDPPLKGTANTLLEVLTLTATVSGGVFVNATGFTGS